VNYYRIHLVVYIWCINIPEKRILYILTVLAHKYPAELPRVTLRTTWHVFTNTRFVKFISTKRSHKSIALFRIK